MTDIEIINTFATSISRELGSIDARLTSIDEKFDLHSKSMSIITDKILKNENKIEKLNRKIWYFSGSVGGIIFVLGAIELVLRLKG